MSMTKLSVATCDHDDCPATAQCKENGVPPGWYTNCRMTLCPEHEDGAVAYDVKRAKFCAKAQRDLAAFKAQWNAENASPIKPAILRECLPF